MKVNDYVRTDIGEIRKVVRVTDDLYVLDKDIVFAHKDKIKKSSPNIIDLIEVGDYVNGCKIIDLATNIDGKVLYLETDITEFDNIYACGHINIYEKDIKSIVTKEQFESMKYKVGE